MPCTIVSNNIASPEVRTAVNDAISAGVGDQPGDWKATVYQAPDYPGLAVRIKGPKKLRCDWTFFGEEQSPSFIRERVAQSVAASLALQENPSKPK
jgi:hypothetical protein